ncbi:hypothetical protein [Aurantivibrio plasticivorans]
MRAFLLLFVAFLASCDAKEGFISGFSIGADTDISILCSRQNQILSASVVEETDESVFVEVEYFYDNSFGDNASIHIEPLADLYWTHQSIKPMLGQHKVIIKLNHPNFGNSPDVIEVKKAEVMFRIKEYDEQRKSYLSSKLTSHFFALEKTFYKKNSD